MNPKELAEKIADACKDHNFKSFIIIGDHDIGMSTYAMKVLYDAIKNSEQEV